MRKFLILILVAVLLLSPAILYAASIGGAETQGQGKFSIGIDQEFVFSRDMKHDKTDWLTPGRELKDIEIKKMYRTMGKISYGVINNLDIYAKLGAADFDAKAKQYSNGVYNRTYDLDGKYAFAYGFGLKGTHNYEDGWLVGIDLQFLSHRNNYKGTVIYKDGSEEPDKWSGKITSYEWQVAPYVAKKISNFTPYVGGKYSDIRIKEKNPNGDWWTRCKAKDNFGIFIGMDMNIMKHFNLNVEGRFIDETAMSVGLSYRF
jgi:opacity protein-like surface antigen